MQQIEAQLDHQEDAPTERDVAEALRTVEPLWAELFPAEKERIVRLLVETVGVRPDGLSLRSLRRDLPLAWDEQRRMLAK